MALVSFYLSVHLGGEAQVRFAGALPRDEGAGRRSSGADCGALEPKRVCLVHQEI